MDIIIGFVVSASLSALLESRQYAVWLITTIVYLLCMGFTNTHLDSIHLMPLIAWTSFFGGVVAAKYFSFFR